MKHLGLVLSVLLLFAAPARADFDEYEVTSAGASLSSYQAGAHADLTTSFTLKQQLADGDLAQTKEVRIDLPPGLIGDPGAIPQCPTPTVLGACPQGSQVGITELRIEGRTAPLRQPVYNLTTPGGDVVARFGFLASDFSPHVVMINIRVRSGGDYGVTAAVEGANSLAGVVGADTTIWGVPASPLHDQDRITPSEGGENSGPPNGRPSTVPPAAFLSNPTRCGEPLPISISAVSYQRPTAVSTKTATLAPLGGCSKLGFEPNMRTSLTTREAAAPSGLDVELEVAQDESPGGLASSHLRDARVLFPEGMTIASGAADGLQGCSAAEVGYKTPGPLACPAASKLGTAEIDVPVLERPLQGAVYQRTPEPGHLFRVWIAADDLGIHVALPGEVELDPTSGRIESIFLDNPQVPLWRLRLHLFGGPRAPFATPRGCGTYQTAWSLTPWSGQAPVEGKAAMTIDSSCGGGGFSPQLRSGTLSPLAGQFATMVTRVTQDAGEQNLQGVDLRLPPGLLAKLKGVPLCGEPEARTGGCPAETKIGTVAVATGPGSNPLWIPQPGKERTAVYLTGPYQGRPYGLAVKVPAQAGPFDLGTVIARAALTVDPVTGQAVVHSDPLPQILSGVPITYRTLNVELDRAGFTVNPTSCRPMVSKATLTSAAGAMSHPVAPFRVGGCAELPFKPKLSIALRGGTTRGSHPGLRVGLRMAGRGANIASASVALPHSLFLAQEHIGTICTRVQFAADACPAGSIYGHARALSPLLGYPLEGPVYLRSSSHPLPDLVAALKGPGPSPLEIDLAGRIDSVRGGIRTTFGELPDAPVSKFTLLMPKGKKSLLVNSTNVCRGAGRALARFAGQNGKLQTLRPRIGTPCKKARHGRPGRR